MSAVISLSERRPLSDAQVAMMSPREKEEHLRAIDHDRRRAEAQAARFMNQVERTGGYAADGHRSAKAWGRATCNWSSAETARIVKTGRMFARFPSAAAAAAEGKLGVAQMHALSQLVANPRVGEYLPGAESALVEPAMTLDYDDYVSLLVQWESIADEDGAHGDHERAHRERNAHLSIVGEKMFLDASGGVVQGVAMRAIFDAFCHSEFVADWEAGVAQHGPLMSKDLMARTDGQRRFDALQAIFAAAAVSEKSPTGGEPVVNLLVGQEFFEHHLRRALGDFPPPLDPNNPTHRCETADGVPVDPHHMLMAATIGHVRRIVLDSKGIPVNVGRKARLFTGPLRDIVLMMSRRCTYPGCNRPGYQCEADHTVPFASLGPTATYNANPKCKHHNLWRTRGYTARRDSSGQWHHYRPDGTEIGWRASAQNLFDREFDVVAVGVGDHADIADDFVAVHGP